MSVLNDSWRVKEEGGRAPHTKQLALVPRSLQGILGGGRRRQTLVRQQGQCRGVVTLQFLSATEVFQVIIVSRVEQRQVDWLTENQPLK